jgi:chemotaxis protein histidine kinase CheA/ActR/RegA family two-component response regulator
MQLTELAHILIAEAQASRDELFVAALELTSQEDGESTEAALAEHATSYADFCQRSAEAVSSIGLTGLAQSARILAEGLSMMPGLPLELRTPAEPLLSHWPDFFMAYLQAWTAGCPDESLVNPLLGNMAQAEFLIPLDAQQLSALGQALLNPPLLAAQQAAMVAPFEPPTAEAMSLALPVDAERSVVEGFLTEGPGQIETLMAVITQLGRGTATAQQLELAHREAHTLKGTAAIAGIRGIATLAHALEDLLELFRQEDFQAPPGLLGVMMASCDQLDWGIAHLADGAPLSADFAHVSLQVHAWASHLQGIEVPPEALILPALSAHASPIPASAIEEVVSIAMPEISGEAGLGVGPVTPTPEAASDDDVQIRIPAKALDKIFRAVNELAIGLWRLRQQSDELITRADGNVPLEHAASLRLGEIERRVTLEGLGRVGASRAASGRAPTPGDGGDFDAIELDKYNELAGATHALSEAMGDVRMARADLMPAMRDVAALAQRQLDFAREARYQITQARLRPLSDLRSRLRRTVRQTASQLGKDVHLEIVGDDLRVDAAVLEPLAEAFLHLLRNCVDHGIEDADVRTALGKPAAGSIKISFTGKSGGVVTSIIDDGQGLDHAAIFDKAVDSGLVAPDAELSIDEISRLIFLPGFSTRQTVSETSGRGVGLDAVVQALAPLQGNVTVQSVRGTGSEFRLFAMATVGTVHALHVEADGEHFLIPSIQLVRADAAGLQAGLADSTPDAAIQDVWLPGLLHGHFHHAPALAHDRPGLVIDVDGKLQRIGVDRILEAREFLISPPPQLIDRLPGISGVTTLANGALGMVLDLLDLSRKPLPVQASGLREMQAAAGHQHHVLVVDDSASVRNTISALLRDENYKVSVARDGLAGMQAIIDNRFDLVLTDLEMPQLNGFELTEFIRKRSEQAKVPVVMLTSRGQEKHRLRAEEAGVNDFLIKPYSDQLLLDTIRHQIGLVDNPSLSQRSATALAPADQEEGALL